MKVQVSFHAFLYIVDSYDIEKGVNTFKGYWKGGKYF